MRIVWEGDQSKSRVESKAGTCVFLEQSEYVDNVR